MTRLPIIHLSEMGIQERVNVEHQQRILGKKSVRSSDINVPSKRIKRDDEVCFADVLNSHNYTLQCQTKALMCQETFLFNTTVFQ